MEMKVSVKKIWALGLCFVMLLGLCACDKDEWFFSLNGEKLYKEDVAAFGYIYAMEYNIKDWEQLDELYSSTTTYGEYYKEQLENDIITTVLLYKEGADNRVQLSEEAKHQIDTNTARVLERFGEDTLKNAGVSESDIENVYKMKLLGEAYLDTLSGDGQDEEDASEAVSASEQYVKVYQVTFPTVLLDEDGMVQSDAEGNLKKLSGTAASEMEQAANVFSESAKLGENMDELLKNCGDTVTGIEKYLKYSDLEDAYKLAVDELSEGDVSDVIESDYGFYVIRLLEKNDTEYAELIGQHEKESAMVSAKAELLNELYSQYAEANKEYKNADKWNAVDMKDFVR